MRSLKGRVLMKPHEYLRLLFSMRSMGQKQSVQLLASMPVEERKEMQLCMLEYMKYMVSEFEDEANSPTKPEINKPDFDDDFLKELFKKHNIK
jgi:hypothetical protein